MVYLPTRYQVSLFVSMGLLMSIVSYELLSWPTARTRTRIIMRTITIAVLFIMTAINGYHYIDTFRHRTFVIRDTNEYLAQTLAQNDLVLGAWAPSLTWDSKSKALPVWNNFLNYQDPVTKFKPKVVIAETNEQDSEQAWSSQGINLKELSDSTKTVRIGQWELVIYWMKPQILNFGIWNLELLPSLIYNLFKFPARSIHIAYKQYYIYLYFNHLFNMLFIICAEE